MQDIRDDAECLRRSSEENTDLLSPASIAQTTKSGWSTTRGTERLSIPRSLQASSFGRTPSAIGQPDSVLNAAEVSVTRKRSLSDAWRKLRGSKAQAPRSTNMEPVKTWPSSGSGISRLLPRSATPDMAFSCPSRMSQEDGSDAFSRSLRSGTCGPSCQGYRKGVASLPSIEDDFSFPHTLPETHYMRPFPSSTSDTVPGEGTTTRNVAQDGSFPHRPSLSQLSGQTLAASSSPSGAPASHSTPTPFTPTIPNDPPMFETMNLPGPPDAHEASKANLAFLDASANTWAPSFQPAMASATALNVFATPYGGTTNNDSSYEPYAYGPASLPIATLPEPRVWSWPSNPIPIPSSGPFLQLQ